MKMTEKEQIQLLADLVAIRSVNGKETEVAEYIKNFLKKYDIEAKILSVTEGRSNLVAEVGNGDPVYGWSGHMDVVDAGDEKQWSVPPFELTEKSGKLYGRGITDMKSGVAAMLIAMVEIKERQLLKRGTIRLMLTTGEENGQAGSQAMYEGGYMEDVDSLLIPEPFNTGIVYAHKGSLNLKITSRGQAVHSSMPDLGFNAIKPLIRVIDKAQNYFDQTSLENELLGKPLLNFTLISGGNQINSLPEYAEAECNGRTIPELDNEKMTEILKDLIAKENEIGAKLTLEVETSLPAVFTNGKAEWLTKLSHLGKKYYHQDIQPQGASGVTDAANLLKDKDETFPFAVFGCGEVSLAHQIDEYCVKDKYLAFPKLLIDLVTEEA